MRYALLGWLPGQIVFLAKDQEGVTGVLTGNGFEAIPEHLVKSAILKHGYKNIEDFQISAEQSLLEEIAEHLFETNI